MQSSAVNLFAAPSMFKRCGIFVVLVASQSLRHVESATARRISVLQALALPGNRLHVDGTKRQVVEAQNNSPKVGLVVSALNTSVGLPQEKRNAVEWSSSASTSLVLDQVELQALLSQQAATASDLMLITLGHEEETSTTLLHDAFLCMVIATFLLAYWASHQTIERKTGLRVAHVCCIIYLSLSVSIDLSIKNAANAYGGSFPFEPACCVIVVECCKLIVSSILLCVHLRQAHIASEEIQLPMLRDVGWLAVPAAIYATNNIIVFKAIQACPLATFGVMRETMLIWNALIWSAVFKQRLSMVRWLAICGIFLGCTLNQMSAVFATGLSVGAAWASLLAFSNAAGGVANEFAMKQRAALDINMQNCILYAMCGAFTFLALVVVKPSKVVSLEAFFNGFVPECWEVIILQTVAGLVVSRVLKYVEAVTKTIVAALRGPCVILLGARLFTTRLAVADVVATFIVCASCFVFLQQGPLGSAKSPSSSEKQSSDLSQTPTSAKG